MIGCGWTFGGLHLITFEALAFQQFTDPAQRPPLLVTSRRRRDSGLRLPSLIRARPGQKSLLGSESLFRDLPFLTPPFLLSSLQKKKTLFKLELHGDGQERELGG